ncbi:helix-loop-helix DNA-binding domain-containing protein [Tricladium varicosporioides]|nr:helix-loop-helix DNA-binding domain-containing protein [Hymenoscyphus varicosporioides]
MASTVICQQKPAVDFFSSKQRAQSSNVSISPSFVWDSSPYSDSALVSSDSCDSVLPSPTSPESLVYPTANPYALPRDDLAPEVKPDQAFNFGSFEDWMRWDDPSDAALSPTSDFFPELKVEPMSPNIRDLELQGSGVGGGLTSDDSVAFNDDTMNDEPLFQTPSAMISPPLSELPQREGLYSTPLSWSRPAPGQRRSMSMNSYNNVGILSAQQESKLRDIAMPSQSQNQGQYPASPSSASSPEPCTDNRRKRKSSVEDDDEEDSPPPTSNGRHPPVKKTAHNMIEKRYRTNLNDKIAALRDSVPSLRVMSKKNSRGEEIQEDLQGLTPAHKLNKATVLSKATEYIAHLEKRNKYLLKENSSLKSRVDAFEILVMSRQSPGGGKPQQRNSMSQMQQRGGPRGYGMDGMMG